MSDEPTTGEPVDVSPAPIRLPGTEHIGDGVYASHDGYQIWLRTERGDGMIHSIALDSAAMEGLLRFRDRCNTAIEAYWAAHNAALAEAADAANTNDTLPGTTA